MQRLFRPVAILSSAAYFLAVTSGVALHSMVHVHLVHMHGGHVHAHAHSTDHAGHSHAESSCCHHHCEESSSDKTDPSAPAHHHHDGHDCVVCDFLAQCPVKAAPVELPPDLELIEVAALITATSPRPRPFSAWQGRAPPV